MRNKSEEVRNEIGVSSHPIGPISQPLVQRRAVWLPPALTIFSQLLLGVLAGFLGLAATSLAAVALVAIKVLYLHEAPQQSLIGAPVAKKINRAVDILGKGILTPSSLSA